MISRKIEKNGALDAANQVQRDSHSPGSSLSETLFWAARDNLLGLLMRDRLTGKHIDLDALAESLKGFFSSSMFRVAADKRSAEFKIVAFPRIGSDLCDSIEVLIQGNPDDFTVQFGESESQSRKLASLGRLTSILGGGVFLKKGLESQAELEKLENSFWAFFDAKIDSLEKR